MKSSLSLYQKYVDLLEYSYILLKKYPKHEKHALVLEIKENIYSTLKQIYLINRKRISNIEKRETLYNIDSEVMILKQFIRISYKEKYISSNNYKEWSKRVVEIGKMIGGFINYAHKNW